MALKEFLTFVWNGGLDPISAEPGVLRQRRTLSTTSFLLIPVVTLLIIANFTIYDAADQNVEVGAVLVLGLLGLGLQAYKGWDHFAAILLVASIWFASTSIILTDGFSSANWVWMISAVLIAILVTTRLIAIVYTGIVIVTLLSFAAASNFGFLKTGLVLEEHAISVAISGSLNFVIMCVVGFAFRTNQIDTERMLSTNVKIMDEEVATRLKAEQEALAGKRAKNTFLTTISHELRTPLNGVIGAGQLLADSPLNPEQQDLVEVLTHSGEDLLDLINNVLDLSRLEAGRLELEIEPFHLRTAIHKCMKKIINLARQKDIAVTTDISTELPEFIVGDEARLKQIVNNLCNNALKFTESGRINLTVSAIQDELQLTVTDTGIGIAEEAKPYLFQPFIKAKGSDDRLVAGTGLGLAIVSELVSLQGGTIKLWSVLGAGSVFTITLPMASGEPIAELDSSTRTTVIPYAVSPVVLVVDDNLVNRQIVGKMLSSLDCQVVEATDGTEVIDILHDNKVDMILMDVHMPGMNGIEATKAIRAMQGSNANLPIIGLTASSIETDPGELLAAGMNYCIAKPVRLGELKALLGEVAN